MKLGTIVKHKTSNTIGVVVTDPFNCCSENEIPVVFEGVSFYAGTPEELLTEIGEERAKPDADKCGMGKGENCCIFLTATGDSFVCQRFGPLRNSLLLKNMTAKREPLAMFPECMDQ